MTAQELLLRAGVHWNTDMTTPAGFNTPAFRYRCMAAHIALTKLKTSYDELENLMNADRGTLRLMWLYTDGLLNEVQSRREYNTFKETL